MPKLPTLRRRLLLALPSLLLGLSPHVSAQEGAPAAEAAPDAATNPLETLEGPLEPTGLVGDAISDVVPETGNAAVDAATSKLSSAVGGMIDAFIGMLPNLVIAALVLVFTWFMAGVVRKLVKGFATRAKMRPNLVDLFIIMSRIGVWFLGFMIAASIVFPGFGPGQLIATAGLASIAIGFAFQDIFENFFAGILILMNFPFHAKDYIEVEGITGQVEDITVRMTKLRQASGELVLIPNATIFKGNVTVLTNRPRRCVELAVGIAYGEDVAEGRKVILEAVKGCDTVDTSNAPPQVLATAFGASSIDFDIIWWTGNTPIDARRSRDQVVEAVKKALDDAGIEIPYPHRTLTVSSNEPGINRALAHATRGAEDAGATTTAD